MGVEKIRNDSTVTVMNRKIELAIIELSKKLKISHDASKPSETICGNCYNKEMAEGLGVENFKDFNSNIEMIDCEGIKHNFEVRKMIPLRVVLFQLMER